jgi:hypothetical protein
MFIERSFVLIFRAVKYVCRLAKRFATQFFIAKLREHTHGYITHLIFLHHLHELLTLLKQERRQSILLYQLEFCIHSHFFRNFVITPKPLPTDSTLRAPKRWTLEAARFGLYGGWGSFVIAYSVFRHVWSCIVLLKSDFGNIFVRLNSAEMFVQNVKSTDLS